MEVRALSAELVVGEKYEVSLPNVIDGRSKDEQLVEQIRNGDRKSLDDLVEFYFPIIDNKVHSMVPMVDADDVTQEIFVSLLSSIDSFQGDSTFATWFFKITRNRIADYYRKRSRSQIKEAGREQDPVTHDPRDWIDNRLEVKETLVKLPVRYREVLLLRFLEGLSIGDVAERLGLTYEAARSRCRRALYMARKRIKE
jgi:RNA polymerase sigma-70 factor (ECF subfamily)